ncbi:hypothetical protein FACS189452_00910 [Bacteroidia bacterium]|nr:hypothetical protein FACS189452_00910 [Bacteroidia bacterium]
MAQQVNSKTFWGEVELGYAWSIADNGKSYDLSHKNFYGNMYMAHWCIKAGYYITPQFSLGAGLSMNGYHNFNINTLPIFVDVRYHLKRIPQLFFYADVGMPIASSGIPLTSGFMGDIGLGYRFALGKRIALNPSVGYNVFCYSQDIGNGKETRSRHSIFLQLGFEF